MARQSRPKSEGAIDLGVYRAAYFLIKAFGALGVAVWGGPVASGSDLESSDVVVERVLVAFVGGNVTQVGDSIRAVCGAVALAGQILSLVGDPIPFVGDCFAKVGNPLASFGGRSWPAGGLSPSPLASCRAWAARLRASLARARRCASSARLAVADQDRHATYAAVTLDAVSDEAKLDAYDEIRSELDAPGPLH